MIGFFLVAALLPFGVLSQSSTPVESCPGGKDPINVRIIGCFAPPCELEQGKDAIVYTEFTVPRYTEKLTPQVTAYVLGLPVKYPLPQDQSVGCDNLDGAYCPLDEDEDVTHVLKMSVTKEYPQISLTIQLDLVDDTGNSIVCFKVAAKVVGPRE